MSEMIASSVRVKIPRAWVKFETTRYEFLEGTFEEASFVEADPDIDDDPRRALTALADNFGGNIDHVDDVEGEPDAVVVAIAGELNYGWWSGDEDRGGALLRLRIPFDAQSDAHYECSGIVESYDGNPEGEIWTAGGTNDGDPFLTASELSRMLTAAEERAMTGEGGGLTADVFRSDVEAWLIQATFHVVKCDISHLLG